MHPCGVFGPMRMGMVSHGPYRILRASRHTPGSPGGAALPPALRYTARTGRVLFFMRQHSRYSMTTFGLTLHGGHFKRSSDCSDPARPLAGWHGVRDFVQRAMSDMLSLFSPAEQTSISSSEGL